MDSTLHDLNAQDFTTIMGALITQMNEDIIRIKKGLDVKRSMKDLDDIKRILIKLGVSEENVDNSISKKYEDL